MKLICRTGEETRDVEVSREGSGYRVIVGEKPYDVDMATANNVLHSLQFEDGRQYLFAYHREGDSHEISFSDRTVLVELFDPLSMKRKRREHEDGGDASIVNAMMPGRVVRVFVNVGDTVKRGQGLLILEAMKMENEIVSPRDGVIASITVAAGQVVESGDELLNLE